MDVPRYSPNYMTDYSYSKVSLHCTVCAEAELTPLPSQLLFVVAQYQLLATQLAQHRESAGYTTIVQLNTGLQAEIAQWEAFTDCSNPNLKPCESVSVAVLWNLSLTLSSPTDHRALLLTVLHHRVLRLHRAFLSLGFAESLAHRLPLLQAPSSCERSPLPRRRTSATSCRCRRASRAPPPSVADSTRFRRRSPSSSIFGSLEVTA